MNNNLRRILRLLIVAISITTAIIYYYSSVNVEPTNMESKIASYLETNSVKILESTTISNFGDKYLLSLIDVSGKPGTALMVKNNSGKYNIRDAFFVESEFALYSLELEKKAFTVIFGESEKVVTKLEYNPVDVKTVTVDSKDTLVVINGDVNSSYVVTYDDGTTSENINFASHTQSKSFAIYISILIAIVGFAASIFLVKIKQPFERVELDDKGHPKQTRKYYH